MILKFIHSTFLVVIIVLSQVYGRRVKFTTPDITEIGKNTSKVNTLLTKVIKNYNKLDKIKTSGSEEANRTDHETNESFEKPSNKKGASEDKVNKTSEEAVRKPLVYFSDKSTQEEDRETGDREKKNKKQYSKSSENITAKSDENKTGKPPKSQESKEKKHVKIIKKLIKQETKQRNDDELSNEDSVTKVKEKKGIKSSEKHSKEDTEPTRVADLSSDEKTTMPTHSPRVNKVKGNPSHKKSKDVSQETIHSSRESKSRSPKSKAKEPVDEQISEPKPKEEVSKSEDDLEMDNEMSKAEALRQAYLDACKVVLIRKCVRAMRGVSKEVCSKIRKCSKPFKQAFKKNANNACDKQFLDQKTACRSGAEEEEIKARRVYTAEVVINKEPQANVSTKLNKKIQNMNILRDRFEKACKSESYRKCLVAAEEASTKTCKEHTCSEPKAKSFRKASKSNCRQSFQFTGKDSDSDEEDNDDD